MGQEAFPVEPVLVKGEQHREELLLRELLACDVDVTRAGRLVAQRYRPFAELREEEQVRAKANEVIEFLQITQVADELAGNLSGGQKKLLELGRTMMVDAKIVFLDEVGAGVNRTLLNTLGDAILRLQKERGYTFCMIEHDMDFISRLCDPVIVMAEGLVLTQGSIEEVKANEQVIEAYLGTGLKNKPPVLQEPVP